MGIFDTIKRVGGNILNAGRTIGGNILGKLDNLRDTIRSYSRKARNIPLVDTLLKTKIPILNQSLDDLGNISDEILDTAKEYGRKIDIKSPQERLREVD